MGEMAFVPEGQHDRSQARSAWNNATPQSRPGGYGVIGAAVRADSMIGVTNELTTHALSRVLIRKNRKDEIPHILQLLNFCNS